MRKFMSKIGLAASMLASATILGACTSTTSKEPFDKALDSEFSVNTSEIMLTVPDIEEREQYQLVIARLTQILTSEETTPEQRAQILYQLGILYDRLGLAVTARNMFMNALIEVPDYAAVYNFVGSYLAASERFSEAYDAFDAVLEIDPEESYAYFNRGIALYYGKRASLGIADLIKFYEFDKNDPFRIAWLYILEREVHGKEYAVKNLEQRRKDINQEVLWGLEILDFIKGDINNKQLIDTIRYAEIPKLEKSRRLCEAYFYMAKMAEFEGKMKLAYDLMHLCVATEVTGYLEYRYALMEIGRFERTEIIAKADQIADKRQAEREALFKSQTKEADKFFEEMLNKELDAMPAQDDRFKPKVVPAVPSAPKGKDGANEKRNPVIPEDKANPSAPSIPAAKVQSEGSTTAPAAAPAVTAAPEVKAAPAAKTAPAAKASAPAAPAAAKATDAKTVEAAQPAAPEVSTKIAPLPEKEEATPPLKVVGPSSSSLKRYRMDDDDFPAIRINGGNA